MKALSLTQPWAWLVIHGGKDIENRRWNTKLRGRFLIHAAKGMQHSDFDAAYDVALGIGSEVADRLVLASYAGAFVRGGIIGSVELVDVWEPTSNCPSKWHFPDQFGFRLRDPRPLPFTPCKGALGFWQVPDALLAELAP